MTQAEAPTFIHSEEVRAEMLARMQEIAGNDEIPAEELEEVGWLILKRDSVEEEIEIFEGKEMLDVRMHLPTDDKPEFLVGAATRGEYFEFTVLDGINPSVESGEILRLSNDEGSLSWRVGIFDTIYSEIQGKRIAIQPRDIVMALEPLSPKEHAIFAKRIVEAYIMGVMQN